MKMDKLLFAVHGGTVSGRPAGIIMADHCLPIAACCTAEEEPDGYAACWQGTENVEEFFQAIGMGDAIEGGSPSKTSDGPNNGLFVLEVAAASRRSLRPSRERSRRRWLRSETVLW